MHESMLATETLQSLVFIKLRSVPRWALQIMLPSSDYPMQVQQTFNSGCLQRDFSSCVSGNDTDVPK